LAATTLLAAGLLVSTFDFADLLVVEVAVFLPTRDFFSIAIVLSPGFHLTALRSTLGQPDGQTACDLSPILKSLKTNGAEDIRLPARPGNPSPGPGMG
jgi:hypothetical protein